MLQAPPLLQAPSQNAEISATEALSWAPFANGVHAVWLSSRARTVTVWTGSASFTPSELTPLGEGLPTGEDIHWTVTGFAPVSNMDAAGERAVMDLMDRGTDRGVGARA